jgi:hypothetical protein
VTLALLTHLPAAAFRGTRDYVHSTDIYEEILAGARAIGGTPDGPMDLRLRGRMTRRPAYHFRRGARAAAGNAAPASADIVLGGKAWTVEVLETDEPITARKPYDETPVWSRVRQEGETFRVNEDTGARPIETVTAIGVLLHRALFPPPPGKRWMLARLSLERPLDDRDSRHIAVSLDKRLGGSTTRTRLTGEDAVFGTMMFMLS